MESVLLCQDTLCVGQMFPRNFSFKGSLETVKLFVEILDTQKIMGLKFKTHKKLTKRKIKSREKSICKKCRHSH